MENNIDCFFTVVGVAIFVCLVLAGDTIRRANSTHFHRSTPKTKDLH